MKKILLLHVNKRNPDFWTQFQDKLNLILGNDFEIEEGQYLDLTFEISGRDAAIYFRKEVVESYNLVIFNNVGRYMDIATTLAIYCQARSIPYIDEYIGLRNGVDKLSQSFLRWKNGFDEIKTFFGSRDAIKKYYENHGGPMILKDIYGRKGRANYLIKSASELSEALDENKTTQFVLQEFVPNDGDYRLLVMNKILKLAMLRQSSGKSHLNNTSQGGIASLVSTDEISPEIRQMAIKASSLENLTISGVDVIINKNTGQAYIMEVNSAPQINSGSYIEEKTKVYAEAVKQLIEKGMD